MGIQGDHTIVVGGGIAGMLAATVASKHFAHVTIVERDDLTTGAIHRRGVPQSSHLHGLSLGGRLTLDAIYGDFTAAMLEAGCVHLDLQRDVAFRMAEGWIKRAPSEFEVVWGSRWTLERVVRELTLRNPAVEVRHASVTGLVGSSGRVTGIRTRSEADEETVLEADLVIDASGRSSRSPEYFVELGYAAPPESIVQPFLGYATVHGRLPDDAWPGDIRSIGAGPIPGFTRGGFAMPEENGLVGIMAAGHSKDYPPGDIDGFTEFLRTALTPTIFEMFQKFEPETEIKTTRTSVNRLRRWNELAEFPTGFVAMGDAACAFNPVYGQGISVAAAQAKALAGELDAADTLPAATIAMRDAVMTSSAFAWGLATGADMAFPATIAQDVAPPPSDPDNDAYMAALRRLVPVDAVVAREFVRGMGLMDPTPWFGEEVRERVARELAEPTIDLGDASRPPEFWDDARAS